MSFESALQQAMAALPLTVQEDFIRDCRAYYDFLVEYNEKVNLTAITEPHEAAVKHFADSAAVLRYADLPQNASVIDVGTGAGFPSLPMKLLRRDLQVTLLDSLQKRLVFLQELCSRLCLEARTLHHRAEDAGQLPALREQFDVATARAVAALPVLAEYCLPFVKAGGVFIALKGAGAREELYGAQKAIRALGGELIDAQFFTIGDGWERCVAVIKKISQTPTKYPRPAAKIKKSPL